jgi:tRNA 2-selenouridine synthase
LDVIVLFVKNITVDEFESLSDPLVVDVRSPSEYAEDHLPQAVNLPVLSDEERDRVGTIYHQDSQFKARREGAKSICRNAPAIIDEIDDRVSDNQPVVLYCWRGGQRSQSIAIILDRIGYDVHRLEGGYKSYRNTVHDYLQSGDWTQDLITLFGLTGSGKTLLLEELNRQGHSVIDLESSANHRGSAFGGVGLGEQPSQKTFERYLYQSLSNTNGPTFIEGESRKIGRRIIPDQLFDDLVDPPRVWVETSLNKRVQIILNEYPWPESREQLIDRVGNLKERLGAKRVGDLQEKLRNDELESVVETLLTQYYDPAYRRSSPDPEEFEYHLTVGSIEESARKLQLIVDENIAKTG